MLGQVRGRAVRGTSLGVGQGSGMWRAGASSRSMRYGMQYNMLYGVLYGMLYGMVCDRVRGMDYGMVYCMVYDMAWYGFRVKESSAAALPAAGRRFWDAVTALPAAGRHLPAAGRYSGDTLAAQNQ